MTELFDVYNEYECNIYKLSVHPCPWKYMLKSAVKTTKFYTPRRVVISVLCSFSDKFCYYDTYNSEDATKSTWIGDKWCTDRLKQELHLYIDTTKILRLSETFTLTKYNDYR